MYKLIIFTLLHGILIGLLIRQNQIGLFLKIGLWIALISLIPLYFTKDENIFFPIALGFTYGLYFCLYSLINLKKN